MTAIAKRGAGHGKSEDEGGPLIHAGAGLKGVAHVPIGEVREPRAVQTAGEGRSRPVEVGLRGAEDRVDAGPLTARPWRQENGLQLSEGGQPPVAVPAQAGCRAVVGFPAPRRRSALLPTEVRRTVRWKLEDTVGVR